MLACSATKIEKENPERAEWLRGAQVRLRDLTHDLSRADASALVRFFEELGVQLERERMKPDDFFSATDRLVELRNGLPRGDGKVLQALRASIS